MPPTLKRILWTGVPVAVVLAGLGFALAEAAGLYLSAHQPPRTVEVIDGAGPGDGEALADPLPATVRRTLPLTMAAWGFGLVAGYELLRRLVKGPAGRPALKPRVPDKADVDALLEDLMRKAEADRAGPEAATPPPAGGVRTGPA